MNQPKVSVSLITYNHARYIEQAIESVLAQRTSFPFELVIGEDESSDGTREIVQRYAAAHPRLIRLHLHQRAANIAYQGRPTGRQNFVHNLGSARGEYIALLDGDDYFTDPEKLQRQADFLDTNPRCGTCFHQVKFVNEANETLPTKPTPPSKTISSLHDLLGRQFFANTASVMYRRGLFPDFPEWFFRCPVGDFPLHVLNGLRGDFGFIDREMAAYRIHSGGVWAAASADDSAHTALARRELRQRIGVVHLYEILTEQLGPEYARVLSEGIAFYRIEAAHHLRRLEDWPALRAMMRSVVRAGVLPRDVSLASVLALLVQGHIPLTAKIADGLRRLSAPRTTPA